MKTLHFHHYFPSGSTILAVALAAVILPTTSDADLTTYDAAIAADHGGGDGSSPYAATLTEPQEFDTTGGIEFDFANAGWGGMREPG